MSTFERLKQGKKLNPQQRKELGRRLQAQDPGLEIIYRDAAGIDVGSESHFVAVPPGRDPQPIREFGSWTAALQAMVEWLKKCEVGTVALQATGVYWMALCDMLEEAGIQVWVVNAPGARVMSRNASGCGGCTRMVCCGTPTGRRSRFVG